MRKKIDKPRRASAAGIPALDIAIANAGGQGVFAAAIGVPNPTISHWRNKLFIVPFEHVPAIVAMANDLRVTPYSLRPDFAAQWFLLAQQLADCHGEVIHAAIEKGRNGVRTVVPTTTVEEVQP
jgi:DNA-binding transcriptional regulator YdaS (Cro superfamily)